MSPAHHNRPLPIGVAPDPLQDPLTPLLASALAGALAQPPGPQSQALRERLLERLTATARAEAPMFTARQRRLAALPLAPGVTAQTLYRAQPGAALRPGEPLLARLIRLEPGAVLQPEALGPNAATRHREWLVLQGSAHLGAQPLALRDYHVMPAGHASESWSTQAGALLFLRESEMPAVAGDAPFTVHDAQAGWPDFAPGLQRRVLWQREGQAALLYYAQPGAVVPHHTHGHDEECLMVQGELFLDDLLLQPGDYQLAPAGTGHQITTTDTGVVIYAHGDLNLQFVA
jgi:quercetin dioxygenase-like cupin family protein